MNAPKTAPSSTTRCSALKQRTPKSAPSPGRQQKNTRDVSQDFSQERYEAKMMIKSLKRRAELQGKLERVKLRLEKAERALAKKSMNATRLFKNVSPTPEIDVDNNTETGLPSWRKPYLEDYTFKSPVVHSLLSNGMAPKHVYITGKMRDAMDQDIDNKDAKELKRLQIISDGKNGVVKSSMVKFSEDLIVFEKMTKGPSLLERSRIKKK